MIEYSEVESKRFGLNIYRNNDLPQINSKELLKNIYKNSIDILICRIPCESHLHLHKLNNLNIPYIIADTLVYYSCDFSKHKPGTLKNNNLTFKICDKNDVVSISSLVEEIFSTYQNHYSANHYLDKSKILEGYKEWACSYCTKGQGKICFIIKKGDKNIGFATCSYEDDKSECEGVLYGVKDEESGYGIYSDIIKKTQQYFFDRNFKTMKVSTQIENYAVQKVWAREGFILSNSFNTIHINSFFHHSEIQLKTIPLKITSEIIEEYGMLSGDSNELHFDDTFARKTGFEKRIAHGLISNALLSKYFGTEFPGKGTIFLDYTYKFLKPLYPDTHYTVKISFPSVVHKKSLYLAVVQVVDSAEEICMFSYYTMLKN